jgi:hypothetical protein
MTPEQIAASLTDAQVRALLQWHNRKEILSACPYDVQQSLAEFGLIERVMPMLTQATPLGRAVLAVLDGGK